MYRGWSLQEMSDKFNQGISTHLDTNGTMGNVMSPNLQIQLSSDLYFAYGVGEVEFYRASPATYINRNNVLTYAPADVPRFEKEGLLIEGTSTNYVLNSAQLNWTQTNCISTLNTTETKAPDGSYTATKVRTTGVADPYFHTDVNVYYSPATKTYSFSIWLWIPEGHSTECTLFMYQNTTGTNGDPISFPLTLTTTPTRYEFTRKAFDEDTALTMKVRFDLLHAGTVGNTVYCWGAQLEESPIVTSYIPTTTAIVTRQPDSCNIMGMYNFPNMDEVSVSVEVISDKLLNVDNRILSLYDESGNEVGYFSALKTKNIEIGRKRVDGVVEKIYTPTGYLNIDDGERHKVAYTFSNVAPDGIYIDSTLYPMLSTDSTATFKQIGAVTRISLGSKKQGVTGSEFNGHFRNLKIYDKALTSTEFNLI